MPLKFESEEASVENPRKLVLYSKVKVGKTELCAHLDDFPHLKNYLIIDLEGGADYYKSKRRRFRTLAELGVFCEEVAKFRKENDGKYPYDLGVVDTVTVLEDMAKLLAHSIYLKSPIGKGDIKNGDVAENVLHLPKGAGYAFLRDAFETIQKRIEACFPNIIYLGHLKLSKSDKTGKEVEVADIDLVGKDKTMICSDADAVGFIYRQKPGVNMVSFKTKEEQVCGGRSKHLQDAEFVISELKEGKLVTHWDKIFISA